MKDTPQKPESIPPGQTTEFAPSAPSTHKDPDYIGVYRVLEKIGEGGMGIVYKAEQREPVRRVVALKVIKLGMDTREVIARFEAERQALALMSHPNVAKVYEAGMTESGRPFFAMEHVPGVPLTQYCDDARLNTRERLELFIPVCHAVQHAHQKGIIHRDLKPTNILVQIFDGKPVPRVIDFGIAKAANSALTQHTLFTKTGTLVGTPEYMSPEQAMTSGLDVDTRTDIYSLGVILYELLTGSLPFDTRMLRSAGIDGMARMIRESEPRKPSTRLTRSRSDAPEAEIEGGFEKIALRHRTELRVLCREIRGDLDWIILKAMEKDRTRRYETANSIALDIQRHLTDEPVLARPPSTAYRISKFTRKHRSGVFAAGLVLIALLLGVIATGVALIQAKRSEAAARAAESAAKAAQVKATEQAVRAQTISSFLEELLASAQPGAEGGRTAKVVDLLDRAGAQMSDKLRDQPEAEISARMTLGITYSALLLYSAAERNYRRAYELAGTTYGKDAERTLEIAADLSLAITESGGSAAEGKDLAEKALADARRILGEHHRVSYVAANSFGLALMRSGKPEQAIAVVRQLVSDARAHPNIVSQADLARYLNNLSVTITSFNANRDPKLSAESEDSLREVLQIAQSGAKVSPTTLALSRSNLARLLTAQGRIPQATAVWRETLAQARSELGESHKITHDLVTAAARGLELMQQYEDAIPYRREELSFALAAQPQDQPEIARIKNRLSTGLVHVGKIKEALALKSESVAARQNIFGIFDKESRGAWQVGEGLKLSVNAPWKSQALRAQTCEAFYQLTQNDPSWPMPADNLIPDQLRFKLFKWQGDAAGREKALSPVAEGNLSDLRSMADPSEGIYLLWIEVPRANQKPLHHAEWISFATWHLSFYSIGQSPLDDAAAWEETIKSDPIKQGTIQTLALDDYWRLSNDLPPRLTLFGTVATSTADFPPGEYGVISRGGTRHRWSVDGGSPNGAWQVDQYAQLQKKTAPIHFRVEHFQTWGQNFFLWLRLQPLGATADAAIASLIDPKEAMDQALSKFADDVRYQRDVNKLSLRGPLLFSASQFKAAADDYKLLTQLEPDNDWNWYYSGCLLAYLGDAKPYQVNCQGMLAKFGGTKDHNIAEHVAKSCMLLAESGMDLQPLNKLVDRALGPGAPAGNVRWYKMTKGIAEYRLGHYEKAANWLDQSAKTLPFTGYLSARLFLAMANQHMGNQAKAREIFDLTVHQIEHDQPRAGIDLLPSREMPDWLIAHIAMREAKALFEHQ